MFQDRHIGPSSSEVENMLKYLGYKSLTEFIDSTLPETIKSTGYEEFPALSEPEFLNHAKEVASKNKVFRSFIGQGYYNTHTPSPILRSIFQNPGWYTAYTPYQAEISQGRLEALLNFQTLVCDLTQMDIANSSLLDEGTALAEAAAMAIKISKAKTKDLILVENGVFESSLNVLKTRMGALGIKIKTFEIEELDQIDDGYFAAIFQTPRRDGTWIDVSSQMETLNSKKVVPILATDLMALTVFEPPRGAEVVVGSSQRFGIPLGYGGPHAAFLSTREAYKRMVPGRIVGVSKDKYGEKAYRLALQTREQHIRREKATSNICTSQVLLAVMASMYAVYHGPNGLKKIATDIMKKAKHLDEALRSAGFKTKSSSFFDTLTITEGPLSAADVAEKFIKEGINVNLSSNKMSWSVSIDETWTKYDFAAFERVLDIKTEGSLPDVSITRTSPYMTHSVFNSYHTETNFVRYVKSLENKDFSLVHGMIPLGSCTMKLNAASEMIPVTLEGFSNIHPHAPTDQAVGYKELVEELNEDLCKLTGFASFSFQPNAGSQGEYAGLLAIKRYHESKDAGDRNICIVPASAHGTNPASAVMAGFKVVVVKSDDAGNIDPTDLKEKIETHRDSLGALMVTYPSTHGVFEENIKEVCSLIHNAGGMVYLDGANMNAMIGLSKPVELGVDVAHLNLHKTFCIPHGGGGPGVGPIGVVERLKPFVPKDPQQDTKLAVSSANYGSASILPISWGYIKMMGSTGLRKATSLAILNANYLAKRLSEKYEILYRGKNNHVAHECIIDTRPFMTSAGVTVDDIAKRLMDYGFHAPTMSWPVMGTLMIEPTESESLLELDRFADAMIAIANEIQEVESGKANKEDNVLNQAPHSYRELCAEEWNHSYTREKAGFPVESLKANKFPIHIGRIDNTHGDRNLMCTCPSIEDYES